MRLYRAISEAERNDIVTSGSFRLDPNGFGFGKWFALNEQNAAVWGHGFAGQDSLLYSVVETQVDEAIALRLEVRHNLDNIGAAIFVTESYLSTLPILSVSPAE